jgi:NADPH-dependent 2,4-dienoyl-CoA reductase/sulfur reductase-like enzyme
MTRRELGSKVVAVSAVAATAGLAAPAVVGAAKPRVVIIGGGAGGATVARYVAKGSKDIDVTLINDSPTYSTCFFSNLYLGGFRSFESISHNYDKLAADYGINVVIDRAAGLEGDGRTVILAGGEKLSYRRLHTRRRREDAACLAGGRASKEPEASAARHGRRRYFRHLPAA